MKNAVIYARYSSSNQREESIAGQLRECRQYAEKHELRVIHEYTDSALTGTSDKRPSFQQMIRDSDRRQFDVVIVWKIDRFARNRYDAAMYRHMLNENGVKVVSAMENISDTPEGIILEGLMESLAEYYSANLAENVKRGMYDSAIDRKILSRPTYGYKRGTDGRYEIDDMQACIVQRVFNEYADGKPYMQILADLNADGVTTGNGNRFTNNSLRKMLRNEKYAGVYRYKDIYDEHGIPAIIDRDLFDRVQAEIKRRSFTRKRQTPVDGEAYLLTGKLFCGHCGSQMTGESVRKRSGRVYRYYLCAGTKKSGCTKKRVSKDWIEREVVRIINDEILTDDFIALMSAEVIRYQESAEADSTLQYLQEQKAQTERKIANVLKALQAGIWTESTGELLRSLEDEQKRIQGQIEHERLSRRVFTADEVSSFLHALKRSDVSDTETQRYLVNSCVARVYLFDDDDGVRLLFDLNYSTDGTEPVSFSVVRKNCASLCLCRDRRTLTLDKHVLIAVYLRA